MLGIAGLLVICMVHLYGTVVLFVPLCVNSLEFLIPAAMVVLLSVNTMSLDAAGRWERYALALPLYNREILATRYQFSMFGGSSSTRVRSDLVGRMYRCCPADAGYMMPQKYLVPFFPSCCLLLFLYLQ